jgi:Zn finger protein HypA/HybF involved in hydrogenase expression
MLLRDPVRLRRIMLRLMLAALAASALLAVLAILIPHQFEPERMIGAAVATAVASALLFWASRLLDLEKNRPTGLLCLSVILAEYIITLLFVWNPFNLPDDGENLGLTALAFGAASIPGSSFFHLARRAGGTLAGWTGSILSVAALVFFLAAIWTSATYSTEDNLWYTGWTCLALSLIAATSLGGAGLDHRHWRWIGVASAVVAFVLALHDIWTDANSLDNALIVAGTLACLIGHANLMFLISLKPTQQWLRLGTIACAWTAGALADWIAIGNIADEFITRLSIAATVCAGCGTVAMGLLVAFNRKALPAQEVLDLKEIKLICPACKKRLALPVRDSAVHGSCEECGLRIDMQLRLPRCNKCGYSLYMLKTDRCPECGSPVAPQATPTLSPT